MKGFTITGRETAGELLKMLAHLRLWATILQRSKSAMKNLRTDVQKRLDTPLDRMQRAKAEDLQERVNEWLLNQKFDEIAIGHILTDLCSELDRKAVSRDAILDVLNTNQADRTRPDVLKYGGKASHLISVLGLENSASCRDADWIDPVLQPLRWCHLQAFMNALKTNPKFDRVIHDGANEHFGGIFGEYRERPLTERLTGGAA